MKKEKIEYLEFDVEVDFILNYDQLNRAIEAINLYYLGTNKVNKRDKKTGKLVARFPKKETPEFRDAVFRVRASKRRTLSSILDVKTGILQPKYKESSFFENKSIDLQKRIWELESEIEHLKSPTNNWYVIYTGWLKVTEDNHLPVHLYKEFDNLEDSKKFIESIDRKKYPDVVGPLVALKSDF
jgi:hypothetical protein